MRILAIGDFHGKCPLNLKKICRDNKVELILCTGDYCSFHIRELFFKYCYGKNKEPEDVFGAKKTLDFIKKDIADGKRMLKLLNDTGVPVISTTGNSDYTGHLFVGESESKRALSDQDFFSPVAKQFKNIRFIEFKKTMFKDVSVIGYPRSSSPGFIPLSMVLGKPYLLWSAARRWRDRKNRAKHFDKLFSESKPPVIFLVHNPPYKTKLDLVSDEKAHKLARGQHYGELITRKLIEKHRPLLCVSGHMHESPGIEMLGLTTVVNTGSAADGQYAIINIKNNNKASVKLKH